MNKHAKSPCCNAPVRRYGRRRRQCIQCHSTWRIRQKQRGRKRNRINPLILVNTFCNHETLTQRANRSQLSTPVIQKRHRYELEKYLRGSKLVPLPSGKLILVIDGVWFQFKNRERLVIYLRAVRPVQSNKAVFLDPVFMVGREHVSCWKHICDQLPFQLERRIVAVVADGFRGVEAFAARNGWILQRCHFHLIAELQRMRGMGKRVKNRKIREKLYQSVRAALEITDARQLKKLQHTIFRLSISKRCPKWMGMRAREFLRHIDDFRAYLKYPELQLPSTTNTVESMGRTIRDLVRRSHGFRTPKALRQWVTALIRIRPYRICNPKRILKKIQPNNII